MIIDFHTHIFPDKIAEKAISTLSFVSGGLTPFYNGTKDGLLKKMDDENVSASVVLNIATNPKQMHNVNDFASSINSDKLIAFGSVHPDAEDALDELERIKSMGLKGVKFHPEYQSFYPDEEKMLPIYKKIEKLGLITVFHAGVDLGFLSPFHCMPDKAYNVLKFLSTPVVFAHWGGMMATDKVEEILAGSNAYFDLSFGYGYVPRNQALRIIEKHGVDKMLIGSDGPWHSISLETILINTLGLTQNEKDSIYYKNAQKLLG